MLEIIIHKISVDLSKDIQLAITVENPFMLEDRIPAPYSLNFEIPPTPKNLKLWGNPNRLGGYGVNTSKWNKSCVIRFQGLDILKGHVVFIQYLDNIKLQFVGVDYNEYLKVPMNALDIGRKYFLGSYDTVTYTDSGNFAYHYARWAEELASGSRGDMVAGPIVVVDENRPFSNFKDPSEVTSSNPFFILKPCWKAQDREYFNCYNPYNGTFILDRAYDPGTSSLVYKSHASIFPQFRVGYLFDVIFGGILKNNPFSEDHLYNLVLPTFYFPQWKKREETDVPQDSNIFNHFPIMVSNPRPTPTSPYPDEPFIELNDFLPSIDSNEFVRSILNLFCMTMYPVGGKLAVRSNTSILNARPTKDWTSKVHKGLDMKLEARKQYIYGYENSPKENINTSGAVELPDRYAMIARPSPLDDQGQYSEQFKIQNQVYHKSVETVQFKVPIIIGFDQEERQTTYLLQEDGFSITVEKEHQEAFNMVSSAIPLPLYPAIFYNRVDNFLKEDGDYSDRMKLWVVPGIKDFDRTARQSNIHLCFFHGPKLVFGESDKYFPSLGANYDENTMGPTVLSWDGQYGLYETYHKKFAEWIDREKVSLNATLTLNPVELKQLDILEKVHLLGRNFFIKKMQYTISLNSISPINIDFIED